MSEQTAGPPCNICGKPWPNHEPACVYVENVKRALRAEKRAEQAEAELERMREALEELREMAGLWKQVDARSGPEGPRAQSVGWFAAAKARASMVYNRADEALKPRATDGSGE